MKIKLTSIYVDDQAKGAELTVPRIDVTASKISMLKDTCGNLIQLTQLKRG